MAKREKRPAAGNSEPVGFSTAALFDDLPPTPIAPAMARCVECGAGFELVGGVGRPHRYCSDPCREANWTRQRAAWAAEHADGPADPGMCRICGEPIAAKVGRGRMARFCSDACRRLHRYPTLRRPADEPDLFEHQPRKETR